MRCSAISTPTAEDWRPSLNAYAASLQLADEPARAPDLRGAARGARLPHHRLQGRFRFAPRRASASSSPIRWRSGKVDFAPFVAVSGAANAAVTAEGAQLCVDGLKHSERYAVVLRQGLPSVRRREPAEIRRLRDLCPRPLAAGALHRPQLRPAAHRPGGHPGRLASTPPKVDVEIYRIGDRNLVADGALRGLPRPDQPLRGRRRSRSEKGVKIWTGTLDTASELNRDVVTAFPVTRGGRQARARRLRDDRASPRRRGRRHERATTTPARDAMVRRLRSRPHGLHGQGRRARRSCARSRAPSRVADVEVRLIARNNEVLATKTTDAAGHVALRSRPRARRGRPRAGPRRRRDRRAITASSTSARAAFDLTDRGVKGRAAPGAVDAYLYTERGVYRTGETVFADGAAARRQGRGDRRACR